jgi:hypothetical protein
MGKPRRRRRLEERDPWTTDPRDPLELLGRLAGRCAQPSPRGGSGGVPMADTDLTSALGYMPDKLAAAWAMIVAGRHGESSPDKPLPGAAPRRPRLPPMVAVIASRAYRRALDTCRRVKDQPINVHDGADRFRLRVVLLDVLEDIIYPERRRGVVVGAKAAKMRVARYSDLYKLVDSTLQEVLNDARRDFRIRMWADELARKLEHTAKRRGTDLKGQVGVLVVRIDSEPWQSVTYRIGPSLEEIAAVAAQEGAYLQLLADLAAAIPALAPLRAGRRRSTTFTSGGVPMLLVGTAW